MVAATLTTAHTTGGCRKEGCRPGRVVAAATSPTPFLGEAFGGGTGLVDVGVVRDPRDHALDPYCDRCVAPLNVTRAANRTGVLADHDKDDSVAEVENLLGPISILLVSPDPVFKEAANRRQTLEVPSPIGDMSQTASGA